MAEDARTPHVIAKRECPGRILGPKEQIDVILHEYIVLRDEMLAWHLGVQNWLAVFIAILAALIAFIYQASFFQLFLAIPTMILIFLAIESNRQCSILYLSMYLGLLEQRVNKLADESLLLWEHSTTSYRTLGVKFRVGKAKGSQQAWYSHAVVVLLILAVVPSLFLFSLVQGALWLGQNLQTEPPVYGVLAIASYLFLHLSFLGLLLFDRFVQQGKVLSIVEDTLREQMLRE